MTIRNKEQLLVALQKTAQFGTASRESAVLLDIGTDSYLRYFEAEILRDYVMKGGSACRFYEGPPGSGKSHLLMLLEDLGDRNGMVIIRLDLNDELNFGDMQWIVKYILQNMELTLNGVKKKSLPDILEFMGKSGYDMEKLESAKLSHSGFHTAMSIYMSGKMTAAGKQLLREYLKGEKITAGMLRNNGIQKINNPLSMRNCEQVLKTAINGLKFAGVNGTMILFDENEKQLYNVHRCVPLKIIRCGNMIRRLIDGCESGDIKGVIIIFGVISGFVELCGNVYPALQQRLISYYEDGRRVWRSPVVDIDYVNQYPTRYMFKDRAIEKFRLLLQSSGCWKEYMSKEMEKIAEAADYCNAGSSGFRRSLMKGLSAFTVQQILRMS